MADITKIATDFTGYYYSTFDTNRTGLTHLYRDRSMLSWEGAPFQGAAAITEKMLNLPFQKVVHKVSTVDVQPSSDAASLVVLVAGFLVVDDSPNPLPFTQLFTLFPEAGSYYVLNDIFRLVTF